MCATIIHDHANSSEKDEIFFFISLHQRAGHRAGGTCHVALIRARAQKGSCHEAHNHPPPIRALG